MAAERASKPGFSCFGCRNMVDGDDKAAGAVGWAMGTDGAGQAHYACPYCASSLWNPKRLDTWAPWTQPTIAQLDAWEGHAPAAGDRT